MAIGTLDQYIASAKQPALLKKSASMTAVAQTYFSPFALAGIPGAGVLAGTNTANGLVPTDATAGCPTINAFGGGAKGYISRLTAWNSVASRIMLADLLFKAGAYSYNSNVTLASQPSFASRVPNGTDFTGTELWLEAVTAFTGNLSLAVTYTNGAGTTGRATGTLATGIAPIVGRCFRVPFASGDTGIQKIESVVATGSTAGTFNLIIIRPLAEIRIPAAGIMSNLDMLGTGMPEVFDNSALVMYSCPDSTATGLPEFTVEIANG